jgi:hypothetical protein
MLPLGCALITKMSKEEQHAKEREEHWDRLGRIVADVTDLLESVARVRGNCLSLYETEKLASVRKKALPVSHHALIPVLRALNEESSNWISGNPENFYNECPVCFTRYTDDEESCPACAKAKHQDNSDTPEAL